LHFIWAHLPGGLVQGKPSRLPHSLLHGSRQRRQGRAAIADEYPA